MTGESMTTNEERGRKRSHEVMDCADCCIIVECATMCQEWDKTQLEVCPDVRWQPKVRADE